MLPEGQDPDDLVSLRRPRGDRRGARRRAAARRHAVDAARPRPARSTRRSGAPRFEAGSHEVVRAHRRRIGAQILRAGFPARLRQLLTPQFEQRRNERPRGAGQIGQFGGNRAGPAMSAISSRGRGTWQQRGRSNARQPMSLPSARLSASPIVRGFRTALPPREALILVAVINHPWLLEHHAEEFAELEFLNPDADHLRRAMMDAATDARTRPMPRRCARRLGARADRVLDRVEAAITHTSDWPARAGASADDVAHGGPTLLPCIASSAR